jgi:hypothetical protein
MSGESQSLPTKFDSAPSAAAEDDVVAQNSSQHEAESASAVSDELRRMPGAWPDHSSRDGDGVRDEFGVGEEDSEVSYA